MFIEFLIYGLAVVFFFGSAMGLGEYRFTGRKFFLTLGILSIIGLVAMIYSAVKTYEYKSECDKSGASALCYRIQDLERKLEAK